MHRDTPNRDSLACDLMEPVRPLVDAFVFDWLSRGPLRRNWFFEEANGNCRLMGEFAAELSHTAMTWRKAVAPYAEEAAKIFWQSRLRRSNFNFPPVDAHRHSEAKGGNLVGQVPAIPKVHARCPVCGSSVTLDRPIVRSAFLQ